ncbi:hypothetical protein D3C81_1139360 [compost metagenome]
MAEADDDFLVVDAALDICFRFVRIFITLLDFKGELIGAAMLGPAQGSDGAGDRGVHIGTGTSDHASGECGGIEFMLGVEDQRSVHRFFP